MGKNRSGHCEDQEPRPIGLLARDKQQYCRDNFDRTGQVTEPLPDANRIERCHHHRHSGELGTACRDKRKCKSRFQRQKPVFSNS